MSLQERLDLLALSNTGQSRGPSREGTAELSPGRSPGYHDHTVLLSPKRLQRAPTIIGASYVFSPGLCGSSVVMPR